MTPTIPIPTDHIYKFYALCGLAIMIASMISIPYFTDRYNERMGKNYLQWEIFNRKSNLSQEEEITKDVLNARIKIDQVDRKFTPIALGGIGAVGVFLMLSGFIRWHRNLQPNQDKLLELQIKKLELEILALAKELDPPPPEP